MVESWQLLKYSRWVSVFDADGSRSLLVDSQSVVQRIARALACPVGNHQGVGSFLDLVVWSADSHVVHAWAHVSEWEGESRVTWEPGSWVEVGVHEDFLWCRRAVLLESWVGRFKSEVNNLSRRNLDGDGHLLWLLSNFVNLSLGELVVHGDSRWSEIWLVQEIVEWHEKHTVVCFGVTNLLQQRWSPSWIAIGPFSIVALDRPRVSDLSESCALYFHDIKQGVSMCILQSIGSVGVSWNIAAWDDHWMVFLGKFVEKGELVTLLLIDLFVLEEEGRSARQLSQTLVTWAPLDSIVVAIQFGVGFL